MYYIGIDFSINSPSMCISFDNNFYFISFVNIDEQKFLKPTKFPKAVEIHRELLDNNIIYNVVPYDRRPKHEDYTIDQSQKIEDANTLAIKIVKVINDFELKYGKGQIHVAIEGYSYASQGNAFIDLIAFNSVLRNELYRNNLSVKVFSPSSIKTLAGKGNASKLQMYDYFLNESLEKDNFWHWCKINKDRIIDDKENIKKPVDDLIDAYFISKKLRKDLGQL